MRDGRQNETGRQSRAQQVRQALDAIYLGQLKTITLVMAGYYLFTTLAHFFFLDPIIRYEVAAVAALAFLVSLSTHLMVRFGKIRERHSHVAIIPAAFVGLGLVYFHIEYSQDMLQMTNAILVLLAFGFITLLPPVYMLLTGISATFYVLCLISLGGPMATHFAFMGGAALLLSILCFVQRYRTIYSLERVLISNREKSQALAAKEAEARRLLVRAEESAAEARRANEAKGVFLANTSHELRTPLTGVLGMMTLLEETGLNQEQQELLGTARFSAKTLLTLINDVLDLARLEEGKLELVPEEFFVGEVAERVVDLLRPAAEEKGLEVQLHLEEPPFPAMLGDAVRIGQILFNLVGNAVKFTDEGRVDVTVGLQGAPDAGRQAVRFTVQDTGIGFPQEEATRLFNRFEQADPSALKRQGGAGLGLAICAELAFLMDGKLSATAKPGEGACFCYDVALPLVTSIQTDADTTPADGSVAEDAMHRPLSVLVAEDNKVNQMLIEKLLQPYPWTLTMVSDGESATKAVLDQDFDLVLMDVRMPVMDGVAATKSIRTADHPRSKTPIIALTANTMAEDVAAYEAAGMNAVVGKPIVIEELKRTAVGVLNTR